jgi:hypothetical protein
LTEQCRPALVEKHTHPKLRLQQFEDRPRCDAASTEPRVAAPRRVSSSLPAEVVITTARMAGVRKIALSNSSRPLPLTITSRGYSGLRALTRYSLYKCLASG